MAQSRQRRAHGALPNAVRLIDRLLLLRAPDFERVVTWRQEQEHKLAARVRAQGATGRELAVMSDAEVERFASHYERLTRHILAEMPARADTVVDLGPDREILGVRSKG